MHGIVEWRGGQGREVGVGGGGEGGMDEEHGGPDLSQLYHYLFANIKLSGGLRGQFTHQNKKKTKLDAL